MISIKFQGWFQCRLATDPDPVDELRGISGYMKSLANEPDFDRIIRFHTPSVVRSHTPNVGVFVTKIFNGNKEIKEHPILNSKVDLEGEPKYFGFNGIISDDGDEPIVPIILSIVDSNFKISRALSDDKPSYPFDEYKPSNGIIMGGNDIADATGIWSIGDIVSDRLTKLKKDLDNNSDEIETYNLKERINFLQSRAATMFFNARMHWNVRLIGKIMETNNSYFIIDQTDIWSLNFWMGGWDPDAQNGYVSGVLKMPKTVIK